MATKQLLELLITDDEDSDPKDKNTYSINETSFVTLFSDDWVRFKILNTPHRIETVNSIPFEEYGISESEVRKFHEWHKLTKLEDVEAEG